jgi:hypothetical protein
MCVSSLTQPSVERIVDASAWGVGASLWEPDRGADRMRKALKYTVLALAVAWLVGAGLPLGTILVAVPAAAERN